MHRVERPAAAGDRLDRTIRLRDGRTLGYAEVGALAGPTLFFFHGTPGARIVLAQSGEAAENLGVRIVVPERPGYGLSTPHPKRTLLSWADDVAELADHLGIQRFAVAGASGGGAYAAACAYAMPARVTITGLICAAGELERPAQLWGMSLANRMKYAIPRWAPWYIWFDLAVVARLIARKPAFFAKVTAQFSKSDRKVAADPEVRRRITRLLAEAFRQGGSGVYTDLVLGARKWGFPVAAIRSPVYLWHGRQDLMAPMNLAEALAARLPNVRAAWLEGAGHLLLRDPRVWDHLLQRVASQTPE
jgi:pimeloyl-ACP methyl ester carboxylesterase